MTPPGVAVYGAPEELHKGATVVVVVEIEEPGRCDSAYTWK